MMKLVKVVEAKSHGGHRLWVRFSDGAEGTHDYSAMVAKGGPVVDALKDQVFFDLVFVSYGVPSWPNGFDVDAVALHMEMEAAGELRRPVAAE